jgi:hypothetical protein
VALVAVEQVARLVVQETELLELQILVAAEVEQVETTIITMLVLVVQAAPASSLSNTPNQLQHAQQSSIHLDHGLHLPV